jgi:hypothetical protein
MNSKILVVAGLAILVGAASVWFFRAPEGAKASTEPASPVIPAAESIHTVSTEREGTIHPQVQPEDAATPAKLRTVSGAGTAHESAPQSTVATAIKRLPFITHEEIRTAFETEPVDAAWAQSTSTGILQYIDKKMADRDMGLASREITCRAETCRAVLTYANHATDRSSLMKIGAPVSDMIREIVGKTQPVSGAMVLHRGGFAGEPATTEIYFAPLRFQPGDGFLADSFGAAIALRDRTATVGQQRPRSYAG